MQAVRTEIHYVNSSPRSIDEREAEGGKEQQKKEEQNGG